MSNITKNSTGTTMRKYVFLLLLLLVIPGVFVSAEGVLENVLDGGLHEQSRLIQNTEQCYGTYCEAIFTINATAGEKNLSKNLNLFITFEDKQQNLKSVSFTTDFEVYHYEQVLTEYSYINHSTNITLENGSIETTYYYTNFSEYVSTKVSTGQKLQSGTENYVRIWTNDFNEEWVDWHVKIVGIPKKVLGIDKDVDFDTHNKGWAIWSNGENSSNFLYYAPVTLSSPLSSNLTSFPAYFRLNTSKLVGEGKMQADCDDLRPVIGNITVDYEIEDFSCNNDSYLTTVWVRVPNFGNNTIVNVYYGNTTATSKQNMTGVWLPAGYDAVWHFAGSMKSSTGTFNQGGLAATCTNDTSQNYPFFGRGYKCTGTSAGSDQKMGVSFTSISSSTNATMSIWSNVSSQGGSTMLQIQEGGSYGHRWIDWEVGANRMSFVSGNGLSAFTVLHENTTRSLNTPGYFAASWDKTNNKDHVFSKLLNSNVAYKNETPQTTWGTLTDNLYVGAGFNGYGATAFYDEVRVSKKSFGDNWMYAEAQQSYSVGAEQLLTPSAPGAIYWLQNVTNLTANHNGTPFIAYVDYNATNSSISCQLTTYSTNSTLVSSSHTRADGQLVGTPVLNASGKYGNAYTFAGDTTNSITIDATINASNPFTMCLWATRTGANITQAQLVGHTANPQIRFAIDSLNRTALYMYNSSGSLIFSGAGPSSVNNDARIYNYYCVGYNYTAVIRCLNGVCLANSNYTGYPNGLYSLKIARGAGTSYGINGSIDEVRLWNVSLTEAELQAEMNSATPVHGNGLVASYSFERYNSTHTFDTNFYFANNSWFDNRTGEIYVAGPNISKTGVHSINISARDNCSNTITQILTLNITNNAPTLSCTNYTARYTSSALVCSATDPDGDALTFADNSTFTTANSTGIYYVANISAVGINYVSGNATDTLLYSTNTFYINVTFSSPTVAQNLYVYDYNNATTITAIDDDSTYGFNVVGININQTTFQADFGNALTVMNYSKSIYNQRTMLRFVYDGDINNNTAYYNQTCVDVQTNVSTLTGANYYDDVSFIVIKTTGQANAASFVNYVAKCMIENTNNRYPIFSENQTTGLDPVFVSAWSMPRLTFATNNSMLTQQRFYLENTTSKTRVYSNLDADMKNSAEMFQVNLINKIRGTLRPIKNNITTTTGDIIFVNNVSSPAAFTNRVAANKDSWDATNKLIVGRDGANASTTLAANTYAYIIVDDLDHLTSTTLYKSAGLMSNTVTQYTGSGVDGSFTIGGANSAKLTVWDAQYVKDSSLFFHSYEQLAYAYVTNYSGYDIIVISVAGPNTPTVVNGTLDVTTNSGILNKTFGYISVADYNNTADWNNAKYLEVDNIALNYSMNIFIDGLDTGVAGANFTSRLRDVTDRARITRGKLVILNDYTAYTTVSAYGDIDMKESFCGRWDGTVGSPVYSYEDVTIDRDRALWAQTSTHKQLAMTFGAENDSAKLAYCYAQYLVLYGKQNANNGNNYFRYGQPDFQIQREIKVVDAGTQLETAWTEINSTYWYRSYSNGRVWINPVSHTWGIENSRTISALQICTYAQIGGGVPIEDYTPINFHINGDTSRTYNITSADIGVANWEAKLVCKDVAASYSPDGRYEIVYFPQDRLAALKLNLWNENAARQSVNSYYDSDSPAYPTQTSWDAYGRNGATTNYNVTNWRVAINQNTTTSSSVDTHNLIYEALSAKVDIKSNFSITSNYDYNLSYWSGVIVLSEFTNISRIMYNNTYANNLSFVNTSNCLETIPTWTTTTINGENHSTCLLNNGPNNIYARIQAPHLSNQTYNFIYSLITFNSNLFRNQTGQVGETVQLNGSVNNDDTINSCTLLVNSTGTFTVPTTDTYRINNVGTNVSQLTLPFTYTITNNSVGSNSVVHWKIQCNDTIGTNFTSETFDFNVTDFTYPTLTFNQAGNNFNITSNVSVLSKDKYLLKYNVTFADYNLFAAEVNITCDVDGQIYYWSNTSISPAQSLNQNASINLSTFSTQRCTFFAASSDSHTAKNIPNYIVNEIPNGYTYYTEHGTNIQVFAKHAPGEDTQTKLLNKLGTQKKTDRYLFDFEYTTLTKKKVFIVAADKPITYLPNSKYPAHFVVYNPATKGGNWIDFKDSINLDVEEYQVNKKNDYEYEVVVTYINPKKNVKFQSIGGTLVTNATGSFYIGNTIYLNSTNVYDNKSFSNYSWSLLQTTGFPTSNLTGVSTGTTYAIENMTNGSYSISFTHPTFFPKDYTFGVVNVSPWVNYTSYQGIVNVLFRNVKTLSTLYNVSFNFTNSASGQINNNPNTGLNNYTTLYLNASNYVINWTVTGYIPMSTLYTQAALTNTTLILDTNFNGTVRLYDELLLTPFNVSAPTSITFQLLCPTSTVSIAVNSTNFSVPITCNYNLFRIQLVYGATSYYRSYILTPDEVGNLDAYLIELNTETALYTGLVADDLLNKYTNPRIFVYKIIGNRTVQITANYVDVEQKIGAYLLLNQPYTLVIESDNQPTFNLGSYFADSSGTKNIRLYAVEMFDPNAIGATPYAYGVVLENSTGDQIITGQYYDQVNYTSAVTFSVYANSTTTPIYTSTVSGVSSNSVVFTYNASSLYNSSTLYGGLTITRLGTDPLLYKRLLHEVTEIPLGIFNYVDRDFVNWFFVILMGVLAIMSTMQTANYVSIVMIVLASLFVMFGWLEMSIGVLAIAGLVSLIAIMKEGERNS